MSYDRRECDDIGEGEQQMSGRYPEIVYTEEGMREGMQIEDANIPWKEPIASPYRERVEQGLLPFEVDGDWPWNEAFFPKPSSITRQDGQ